MAKKDDKVDNAVKTVEILKDAHNGVEDRISKLEDAVKTVEILKDAHNGVEDRISKLDNAVKTVEILKDAHNGVEDRISKLEDAVEAITKRFNSIAGQLRVHFGLKDGFTKTGMIAILCMASMIAITVYAGTQTIWDISNPASGKGVCKVTGTDGTNYNLTVDIITAGVTNIISLNTFTTKGTTTLGGTTVAVTNNLTVAGTEVVTGAFTASGGSTLGGTTVAVTNNLTVGAAFGVTGASTLGGAATFGSTVLLSTNVDIIAGNFASRTAAIGNTIVSNAPIGSMLLCNSGAIYIKTAAITAGTTQSLSRVTVGNVE